MVKVWGVFAGSASVPKIICVMTLTDPFTKNYKGGFSTPVIGEFEQTMGFTS